MANKLDDLLHFLVSLAEGPTHEEAGVDISVLQRGERIFDSIGCLPVSLRSITASLRCPKATL